MAPSQQRCLCSRNLTTATSTLEDEGTKVRSVFFSLHWTNKRPSKCFFGLGSFCLFLDSACFSENFDSICLREQQFCLTFRLGTPPLAAPYTMSRLRVTMECSVVVCSHKSFCRHTPRPRRLPSQQRGGQRPARGPAAPGPSASSMNSVMDLAPGPKMAGFNVSKMRQWKNYVTYDQSVNQACTPYGAPWGIALYIRCMLIGSKNLKRYWNVASKVHSFVLPPPNEPILRNDSASPICSPSIVLDARVAFAPRVANAKLFVSSGECGVEQHEMPVSNTNHNTFATSSQSSRREQSVQLGRSKCARFYAMRVSRQCTAEGPQWSAKFSKMNVQGLRCSW